MAPHCCFNIGPLSLTLANVETTLVQHLMLGGLSVNPANTEHSYDMYKTLYKCYTNTRIKCTYSSVLQSQTAVSA